MVVLDPTLDCLLIDAVSLIRSSCSLYLPVSQRKQRMITPKTGLFGSLELKFLPLPRPLFLCVATGRTPGANVFAVQVTV